MCASPWLPLKAQRKNNQANEMIGMRLDICSRYSEGILG